MDTNAQRALIIGNSDGIGLALTRRLLARAYLVTGVSRRESPIRETAYDHTVLDVCDPAYSTILRALQDRRGPFDVCVYCAAIGDLLDPSDLSGEARVFRVNLVGAVETAAVILRPMIAASRGHFVGLSSIGDEALSATAPSYAASKAGLSSYLAGLALAMRPRGIRVSNVRFGFVNTKMAKSAVKPMMISVERAVDIVMRCLSRRPARMTHPWTMAAIVRVLRWVALGRLFFS
ncbi:MAG: SDR family NAD(P)-dependent oxidoreductase [Polyangiaceae bacterium]|jgi:NAD(P)-dependent dehydrogenase (short-subunit alcohol dehydrogenase family)